MIRYFIFIAVGKLTIYFLQKFPFRKLKFLGRLFEEGRFLKELFDCDLCLGFWVYTVLDFFFCVNLFDEWFYFVGVTEILVGIITSFIVHLISIGWKDKFGTFILE